MVIYIAILEENMQNKNTIDYELEMIDDKKIN